VVHHVLARGALGVVCLSLAAASIADAASTGNTARQTGRIVSQEPSKLTPNILDGTVTSITQVGNKIIVGGTFTRVQNAGSTTTLTRNRVFAFDATTGKVSTGFAPNPNGIVYKVQAASDGTSVYLGGKFTSAAGATVSNLVRVNASTGARITTFKSPTLTGEVRDLEVTGSRLWVAGKFTHVGTKVQKALATLNAGTGAYDSYFTGTFAGLHRPEIAGSVTDVLQISTNPANSQLVAVGNFLTVNGSGRAQIAKFNLGTTASLSSWSTELYKSSCDPQFDTAMSDVQYSPDGSYFVVAAAGGYGGNASASNAGTSGCDVVARFSSSTSGVNKPAWTAYTGGDSTWSIEVTDNVIYAGGHQRYQNNPGGANTAGPGAVARTGIAALNPVNGMAYSWNPTRSRGVGVKDMLANSQGLYVGSDTTTFGKTSGNTYHARLAMVPLSGGKTLPTLRSYALPASVYTVATGGSQLVRRSFSGTGVTATANAPAGPGWSTTVGAFMINGVLYKATSNGVLTRQSFDGTSYGRPTTVDAADALVRQADWHDTDIPSITTLFYAKGKIYYARAGQNVLYNRAFEVEDDVVGQQEFSGAAPTGISYATMRGAFVAQGGFYYADTAGRLYRAGWRGGAPVGGSAVQVSGPGKDGHRWGSRALFVYQAR
jgi:hypothetical protein